MGVTIHFEGKLRSTEGLAALRLLARTWAASWSCEAVDLGAPKKKLSRMVNDAELEYEGPVAGVQLQPHPDAEPLMLEFDDQLIVQDYCKTQFAPIETHVEIIRFLREAEPHFEWLEVFDEGGYWETSDMAGLRKAFSDFEAARDAAIADDPTLEGPVRLASGRIADLMRSPRSRLN